jgi:hypothetical protein
LITEREDALEWQEIRPSETIERRLELGVCGSYGDRITQLVKILNERLVAQQIINTEFRINPGGTLRLVILRPVDQTYQIKLKPMSSRVGILLGYYDADLETLDSSLIDPTHVGFDFPAAPMMCFGNVLYLVSNTSSSVIGVNHSKNGEYKLAVAYKYSDILVSTCPMVSKIPGYWNSCRAEDLSRVEFQLTDWKFNPIKILNPIHISIELEFINSPLD